MPKLTLHRCSSCDNVKERSEFYTKKDGRIGTRCKECVKVYNAAIPKENIRIKNKKANLKKKYGLTLDDFNELIKDGCRICSSHYDLVVDHDHDTGEVRGALCRHCNSGLGMFKDNPELLTKAAEYLTCPR